MDLGIFIPIGNNGWMMSENAPQYMPSFALNRAVAERAEAAGVGPIAVHWFSPAHHDVHAQQPDAVAAVLNAL